MTVGELIENLKATEDMDKEILIDIDGVKHTIENRLLGYENHVDIIADERYTGNDFYNFDNFDNFDNQFSELSGVELIPKTEIKARIQDRNGGMDMTRAKANEIANEFFKDMNPTFWNGNGDRPDTFDDRIWECELSEYDDLNISLYYDGTDWVHCCEIVDKQSDTMTEMLTGYGIDSALNLVDTIMDLCRGYE